MRPSRASSAEHVANIAQPLPGRIVHRRVDMAVEPVRHARFFRGRRPRGDDAQIAIDLHGIGVDDGAAEPLGQPQRQRRLAAGGRPCNKHRAWRLAYDSCRDPDRTTRTRSTAAAVERARAALPGAGAPRWLAPAHRRRHSLYPGSAAADQRALSRTPARRSPAAIDVVRASRRQPPQEAVPGRHGLDHDRAGMHRRAGRLCRPQSPCRRHHRARHARRDRLRAGFARARGAARRPVRCR